MECLFWLCKNLKELSKKGVNPNLIRIYSLW